MLNAFECKELENIYNIDKKGYKLSSSYIYSFWLNDTEYYSDLYCSYLFWYKVYEIAKMQFFNQRFVSCMFDNIVKYHHAINYVIHLIKKDIEKNAKRNRY